MGCFTSCELLSSALTFQLLLADSHGVTRPVLTDAIPTCAEFGLACHLGVLMELPCVGVAKNLLQVQGVSKSEEHQSQVGPGPC